MRNDKGYVYMVVGSDGVAAKIGFTVSPYARLAQLQSASPTPLRMEFAVPATKYVETLLHEKFAASRIRLEWFSDVDRIGEAFAALEQEHADRQLAREFYGSSQALEISAADAGTILRHA